jgi:hypothetical protein
MTISWYYWKALDDEDFFGGNFVIFKLKVVEILNFEEYSSLEIHLKFTFQSIVRVLFTLGTFCIVMFAFGQSTQVIVVYIKTNCGSKINMCLFMAMLSITWCYL